MMSFQIVLASVNPNGYDINNRDSRTKIVHAVNDCNIFINNAHEGFGQVELLNDIFTAWKDKDSLIINIGVDTVPYTQLASSA